MARFLVVIGVFLFLSSCSKDGSSAVVSNYSNSFAEGSNNPQDLDLVPFVEFKTKGVYCNLCSTVKVLIYLNRKATLKSEYFERMKGVSQSYEKRASSITRELSYSEYSKLDHLIGEMNFFELSDDYTPTALGSVASTPPCGLTHGQTYRITVRKGSHLKTVQHYAGCESDENSRKLPILEDYVQSLVDTETILRKSVLANTNTAFR